jgi:hypothetical protein
MRHQLHILTFGINLYTSTCKFTKLFSSNHQWHSETGGLVPGLVFIFVCFVTGEFTFVAAISFASSGLVIDFSIGTMMTLFFSAFNLGAMMSAFTVEPVYHLGGKGLLGTALEGGCVILLSSIALRLGLRGCSLQLADADPSTNAAVATKAVASNDDKTIGTDQSEPVVEHEMKMNSAKVLPASSTSSSASIELQSTNDSSFDQPNHV